MSSVGEKVGMDSDKPMLAFETDAFEDEIGDNNGSREFVQNVLIRGSSRTMTMPRLLLKFLVLLTIVVSCVILYGSHKPPHPDFVENDDDANNKHPPSHPEPEAMEMEYTVVPWTNAPSFRSMTPDQELIQGEDFQLDDSTALATSIRDIDNYSALTLVNDARGGEPVPFYFLKKESYYTLVFYYTHWNEESQNLREVWKTLMQANSESYASFVTLVEINCEVYKELCIIREDVTAVPTVRFYSGEYDSTLLLYTDNSLYRTARSILDNFERYFTDWMCDESQDLESLETQGLSNPDGYVPFVSDEILTEEDVKSLNQDQDTAVGFINIDDFIPQDAEHLNTLLQLNKYVFVAFFGRDECPDCSIMGSLWDQLVLLRFHHVVLVKVDCSTNPTICEEYDVKVFPTLRFFTDGKPNLPDYAHPSTDGTVVSIRDFLAMKVSLDYGPPFAKTSRFRAGRNAENLIPAGEILHFQDYRVARDSLENVVMMVWYSDTHGDTQAASDFLSAWYNFARSLYSPDYNKNLFVASVYCDSQSSYSYCPEDWSLSFIRWYHNGEQFGSDMNTTSSRPYYDEMIARNTWFLTEIRNNDGERDRELRLRRTPVRRHLLG